MFRHAAIFRSRTRALYATWRWQHAETCRLYSIKLSIDKLTVIVAFWLLNSLIYLIIQYATEWKHLNFNWNLPPAHWNSYISPLTPQLNPFAQRCLMRYFTGDFASWTVHFFNIFVKNQQMQQLFIHHHHKHQGLGHLARSSPELQLLSPTFLRSPNCSLSLWTVVIWF
jgi:hypothetical protein